MSVTAEAPFDVTELLGQLPDPCVLKVSGDPAKAGAILSSDQAADAQIGAGLTAQGVTWHESSP